ncbi:MAG: tetratricopeptide repeat protein [Kofleriaceae bacterium]|nr:tetratricopeptide repeat protein [Kofleriaceae bacterium]
MPRAALAVLVLISCSGPQLKEHVADLSKLVPATLEAERPRDGDPRTVKIRVYADSGVRARDTWKDEIAEQVDYASQLLTPLLGAQLTIESTKDWSRTGDVKAALAELQALDKAEDVTFVVGYVTANDTATKVMSDLGASQALGRHIIVRAWAEQAETDALASTLPDLKEAERAELIASHRRHKQTVVLLHHLAASLGAIAETDPTWIAHPSYSPKQHGFADRTRELMTIGIDERLAENTDPVIASKLLEAIEKAEWGGWIASDKELRASLLRNIIDAGKAGKTASDIPPAALDHVAKVRTLAKNGDTVTALSDLDNLLTAYPGNASMHQLKCEIMLVKPGVADVKTRAACKRVSELAPGDPLPHLAVGEALLRAKDTAGARAELVLAESKIGNLPSGADDVWRRVIAMYKGMEALTWAEEAIAKAKLDKDPIAAEIATTRTRYGIPRNNKVKPEQEAALVAAVKGANSLINASKYGEAEKTLATADRSWPNAPGVATMRCSLGFQTGRIDAARAACNKALSLDPNTSWALYLAAVIALRDASGTKAGIEKLEKAIKVDPELGQAWRALAKAYHRAGNKTALDQLAKDYQARFGQPLPR